MTSTYPLKNIAIYYANPINVNGNTTVSGAATVFNAYFMTIFGAGLEEITHPEHTSTTLIIAATTSKIYGYIDSTLSTNTIKGKVDKWLLMGVTGIFMDRFGYDFGLTRTKQTNILNYIHGKSLKAFVNAWDPDDVFDGTNSMTSSDWYLAAPHYLYLSTQQELALWREKSDKMKTYKSSTGVSMACVTSVNEVVTSELWSTVYQQKWEQAYYSHAVYGFDASGFGEYNYSATNALLPFRSRPTIIGTKTKGSLSITADMYGIGIYEQATNVGIKIDTTNHTYSLFLS